MATSYSNTGGTGDRRSIITIYATRGLANDDNWENWIDGSITNNSTFVTGGAGFIGDEIVFDFRTGKILDEIKVHLSSAASQGTWQPAGSNDGENFTNIGSPVAFTVAIEALLSFTNSTSYRYYRIRGDSGTVTQVFWREMEFKLEQGDTTYESTTEYSNSGGTGDRDPDITVTATTDLFNEADGDFGLQKLVNGVNDTGTYPPTGIDFIGKNVTFYFGTGKVIDEIRLKNPLANDQATWIASGSNDGTNFTTLGSARTFPRLTTRVIPFFNLTSYSYYRLTGDSGTITQTHWYEVEFRTKDGTPDKSVSDDLNNWGEAQLLGLGLLPSENANNLSDAVALNESYLISSGDNLDSWADAVIATAFEITVALSVAVSDNFIVLSGPPGQRHTWRDGIIVQNLDDPTNPIFISLDDLSTNLDDSVALTLAVFFNNLSAEVFDSMSFYLADAIAYHLIQNKGIGDTLHQSDQTQLLMAHFVTITDTLSMSDSLENFYAEARVVASDLNSWSDAVVLEIYVHHSVNIADTMNNLADAVATMITTSNIHYLRRYVNDVING